MMKEEFEKLATRPFTASEYKEIEYVYNYHPSIENKAQIASLYDEFGMRIIRDMRPTAEKLRNMKVKCGCCGQNLQAWKLPTRISRTVSAIANAAQLVYTKQREGGTL